MVSVIVPHSETLQPPNGPIGSTGKRLADRIANGLHTKSGAHPVLLLFLFEDTLQQILAFLLHSIFLFLLFVIQFFLEFVLFALHHGKFVVHK